MVSEPQPSTGSSRSGSYIRAAIWTLLGALFFALMNAAAQHLGVSGQQSASGVKDTMQTMPVFQITFARYAVAALVMLPFMFSRLTRFNIVSPSRYLVRTIAGFGGIALMFAAIQTIPLASATAIGFTSPIFAMVFSALFLQERVPKLRWWAAAIGLVGALIIASPSSGVAIGGAIIALAAAAFMGAEIVSVKWLAETTDGPVTILFFSNLTGVFVSAVFMLSDFVWPALDQAIVLVLLGSVAILGQACFIRAAKLADANFLAPFFYVSLFYAAVIGYVVFNETLSWPVVIGCLIILASAAVMLMAGKKTPFR